MKNTAVDQKANGINKTDGRTSSNDKEMWDYIPEVVDVICEFMRVHEVTHKELPAVLYNISNMVTERASSKKVFL